MSIVVSVKVRNGIVLGTESMTQIYMRSPEGQMGIAQTYSNAKKLFGVAQLKMGVMSYGAGNIGNRSIQGLLEDFSENVDKNIKQGKEEAFDSVEKVTTHLSEFLIQEYSEQLKGLKEEEKPLVGIFIGGYSNKTTFPEEWEFALPKNPKAKLVRPKDSFGASWRGVSLPYTRLHMGIDPRLEQELVNLGVDKSVIEKAKQPFKTQIAYDAIPLQDAINYAHHILRTTISHTTFEIGPPSCGGPLSIAVITKANGFEWVTKREYEIQHKE